MPIQTFVPLLVLLISFLVNLVENVSMRMVKEMSYVAKKSLLGNG